jgi:hypothetical protein
MPPMSDLERRGGHTPRATREQRAYRVVMVGGAAAVVGVGGFLLAVVGVIGFAIPLIALVVAAICGLLFRSTVKR